MGKGENKAYTYVHRWGREEGEARVNRQETGKGREGERGGG